MQEMPEMFDLVIEWMYQLRDLAECGKLGGLNMVNERNWKRV